MANTMHGVIQQRKKGVLSRAIKLELGPPRRVPQGSEI